MRVVGVVNEESLATPFATMLRLGGVHDFSVTHVVEDVADLLGAGDVDVVVTGRHCARGLMELVAAMGDATRSRSKFALMTSVQNSDVVRLAAELEFDAIVDIYQDPVAVHQQLRNIVLMAEEWRHAPDTSASPAMLFLATRDALDRSIIAHVALGMTDKQIASEIGLAPQTVRNRLSKIMLDAGLTNRTQLAHMWLREQSLVMGNSAAESAPRETL